MKLKVYQQGGGLIYTPFIPGAQGTATSGSGRSSGGDDDKIDPLDKELIALMKDQNLLPSDIQAIYNQLIAFQRKAQHLTALGGSAGYRAVMPGMLQIMQMVSVAKNNKERFDKSAQLMTDREAGGEVALDSYGYIWVQDRDGHISKISPTDFDRDKYQPLSNSQLLDYRRNNPQFAFDVGSFETVGNNIIGMKQVQQEIADIITKFGNTKEGRYLPKEFQNLAKEVAEKGYFKITVDRTRSLDDIAGFTKLLWESLGNNARNLLTARAAISPYTSDPLSYLSEMIFADSKQSYDEDFDASMSKAGGGASDEGMTGAVEDNYLTQLGNLQLTSGQAAIVPKGVEITDRNGLIMDVYKAGSPVDDKLQVLPSMSLADFRTKAWASKAGNMNAITFGNRILDPTEYDKIMYDGSSEINVAMLPYKYDEETGKLTPDLDKILALNEVQKELKPDMSPTEVMQLFQSHGLNINDFKNGTLEFIDVKPFITISAYASDDTISLASKTKRFLVHLDNSHGKQIIDQYSNMIVYGKLNPGKNDKKINKHVNTPERWDIYRGNVYIPMEDAAAAMLLSGVGQYHPKSEMTNYASKVEVKNAEVASHKQALSDPNYDTISKLAQWQ